MRYSRRTKPALGALLCAVMLVLVSVPSAMAAGKKTKSDARVAAAGLLVRRDIPDTWTAEETTPGKGFGPNDIAECKRVTRATRRSRTAYDLSDRFVFGTLNVSSSVSVYKSAAKAKAALKAIAGKDAQVCLSTVLQRQLKSPSGSSTTGQTVSIQSSTPPTIGRQPQSFLVDAKGENANGPVSLKALLVVTRVGRATLAATFQQTGAGADAQTSVPPPSTVTSVLAEPAVRLAQAQS